MKKLFGYMTVLCAVLVVLSVLAGCSGSDSNGGVNAVGTWKISVNEDGLTYQQTQIYKPIVDAMDGKLEIKSEGKLQISAKMNDEDKSGEGTWTLEGEKLTINDPIGALGKVGSVTFTYKDGKFLSDSQKHVCLIRS